MKVLLSLFTILILLNPLYANLPYPIIFVHGLTSDHETWESTIGNIQQYAELSDPYVYHICLNHDEENGEAEYEADVEPMGWTNFNNEIVNVGNIPANTRLFAVNFNEDIFNEIWDVNFDHSNTAAIVKQGYALKLMIERVISITDCEKAILIGHSMGGLAIREYLQRTVDDEHVWWFDSEDEEFGHRVARVATLGTPHLGANTIFSPLDERGQRDDGRGDLVNAQLEALRDLRFEYNNDGHVFNGVYLFGGDEEDLRDEGWFERELGWEYYNYDVNCNGHLFDNITGINQTIDNERGTFDNQDMPLPTNTYYSWICFATDEEDLDDWQVEFISFWVAAGYGDGIVPFFSQALLNGGQLRPIGCSDLLTYTGFHMDEPSNFKAVIAGFDEPGNPNFAYNLNIGQSTRGFVTFQPGYNPDEDIEEDVDYFRFHSGFDGTAELAITMDEINGLELDNWQFKVFVNEVNDEHIEVINSEDPPEDGVVSFDLIEGQDYFIEFTGTPHETSHEGHYELRVELEEDLEAEIVVEPSPLDFGEVTFGESERLPIIMRNIGEAELVITRIEVEGEAFICNFDREEVIENGSHIEVLVTFEPEEENIYQGTMTISCNDPVNQEVRVSLIGHGVHEIRWTKHTIGLNFYGAHEVEATDFDNDDDIDVLSFSSSNQVVWWENIGFQRFSQQVLHQLEGGFNPHTLNITDLDDDGNKDLILGGSGGMVRLMNDGEGNIESIVINDERPYLTVSTEDLDSDGDIDIITAGGDEIFWYENNGELEFSEHLIKEEYTEADDVYAKDMDNDGDIDIVGTSSSRLTWWENNGREEFWEHYIGSVSGENDEFIADINNDGYLDILVCFQGGFMGRGSLIYYENDRDRHFNYHALRNDDFQSFCVIAEDLDNDGDKEIISGRYNSSVFWWENLGQNTFEEYSIDDNFSQARAFNSADLDSDDDYDILCASNTEIVWWENSTLDRNPGFITVTSGVNVDPDPVYASRDDNFSAGYTVTNTGGETLENVILTTAILNSESEYLFDLEQMHVESIDSRESIEYGPQWGYLRNPGRYAIVARARINNVWIDLEPSEDAVNPTTITVLPGLTHFEPIEPTDNNHSLLITEAFIDEEAMGAGNEIAVFTPGGLCAGATVWQGDVTGFAVYGDEERTEEIEGFEAGQEFAFRIWDYEQRIETLATAEYEEGGNEYRANGISVLQISAVSIFEQRIALNENWNMISTNIDLENNDIVDIMQAIVDRDHLFILKNALGQVYVPAYNYINIDGWNTSEGYQVKVTADEMLVLSGPHIPFDRPINLAENWQMIAYYPTWPLDARVAFEDIVEHVLIIKDNEGHFYLPSYNYSNMGNMRTGNGYQVKMEADAELVYTLPRNNEDGNVPETIKIPVYFSWSQTGLNMSLLITEIDHQEYISEIGAISQSGICIGGVSLTGDYPIGFAIWGDDPTTDAVDGLLEGESFILRSDNQELNLIPNSNVTGSRLEYETDSYAVLEVKVIPTIPQEFYLEQNYPNPFNAVTQLKYGLPQAGLISIRIYDTSGCLVATLVNKNQSVGHHVAIWEAGSTSSGLYLVKMESDKFSKVQKIVLTK